MVKQNIKIAIISIIACLTFWLILFNFIKIDITTTSLISLTDQEPRIAIESNVGSYIENHSINRIKVNYQSQYYWCTISLVETSSNYYNYWIALPESFEKTQQYVSTIVIVDKLNVYQYLFTK